FWTFGELDKDRQKALDRDSRPMANYGLVLRASYPDIGGSWVKQVELDEAMQVSVCLPLSINLKLSYDIEREYKLSECGDGRPFSSRLSLSRSAQHTNDVIVKQRPELKYTTTLRRRVMSTALTTSWINLSALISLALLSSLTVAKESYACDIPVFSEGIYWMNIVPSSNRFIEVFSLNHLCDFWASSRCSVTSLSLVTCKGKSTRVMAVGNDSSVRLISRKRQNLSTVLPPPSISPLNILKDVAYNREFNMMYLLIDEQEIWVYYTRTNPATRVESWKLYFIEDIHNQHSQDALQRSRANSPWPDEGNR
ncbi:unnamed protein product, partial [Pocillopora meandrina]